MPGVQDCLPATRRNQISLLFRANPSIPKNPKPTLDPVNTEHHLNSDNHQSPIFWIFLSLHTAEKGPGPELTPSRSTSVYLVWSVSVPVPPWTLCLGNGEPPFLASSPRCLLALTPCPHLALVLPSGPSPYSSQVSRSPWRSRYVLTLRSARTFPARSV